MKKILLILFIVPACGLYAQTVVSTSWTAAFADLAGIDNVTAIAPAQMIHPPEYEITAKDIETISKSKFFIYAGFERMMKVLGDAVGTTTMIKITCDNSIKTVKSEATKIALITGTQDISTIRVKKYISTIEDGVNTLKNKGLYGVKVYCNKNQIYLARDLGFNVIDTFGPGPVTAEQIKKAKEGDFTYIIDNVHNPVGKPLLEVSKKAQYIVWRNFPEKVEKDALIHVVQQNIEAIKTVKK